MSSTSARLHADPSGVRRRRASSPVLSSPVLSSPVLSSSVLSSSVLSSSALPTADLESFWPSRRGHAFDQHCR